MWSCIRVCGRLVTVDLQEWNWKFKKNHREKQKHSHQSSRQWYMRNSFIIEIALLFFLSPNCNNSSPASQIWNMTIEWSWSKSAKHKINITPINLVNLLLSPFTIPISNRTTLVYDLTNGATKSNIEILKDGFLAVVGAWVRQCSYDTSRQG